MRIGVLMFRFDDCIATVAVPAGNRVQFKRGDLCNLFSKCVQHTSKINDYYEVLRLIIIM